jgi:hypothetical protein
MSIPSTHQTSCSSKHSYPSTVRTTPEYSEYVPTPIPHLRVDLHGTLPAPSRNQNNDVVGIRLLWNLDMVPNDSSKVRVTRRVYISIHT